MFLTSLRRLTALAALPSIATMVSQPFPAFAQYAINWHTMDGGGGTSTGGVYSVSGTIGQPDAATKGTNGQYSVTGGFWSGVSVLQTPAAPLLSISLLAGGQALLSWPVSANGFVLEEAASVSGSWTNTPQAVVDTAGDHTVTVPASGSLKVFRLKK